VDRLPISTCIITYNEERNIRRCLESVLWTQEIIVLDSYSTDGTVAICREYTDRVHQEAWKGHIQQKNHCLRLATHQWVLCLDADEQVSTELREDIFAEFAPPGPRWDGYYFPRHSYFFGKWINHAGWYPDYKLRLFKKDKGSWGGINPHDRVILHGHVKYLPHDLLHFTYADLSQQLKTVDSFSTVWAREMYQRGKKFSRFEMVFRPPIKFLESYVYKHGVFDGLPGFLIACGYAYQVLLRYAKLRELETQEGKGGTG